MAMSARSAARCCRSPRGERGLKSVLYKADYQPRGRSPRGERGLKSILGNMNRTTYKSLPSRGAWIEIKIKDGSPRTSSSRSPRGERGLKLRLILGRRKLVKSLPSRGAWIEIIIHYGHIRTLLMSLPSRGAWIEIQIHLDRRRKHARRSPRGERGLK